MAGADIRRYAQDRRGLALNVPLGLLHGALRILADTLLNPLLVLVLFAAQLTNDYVLLGLIPVVSAGVWYLAQLVGSSLLQGRQRKLPWAVGAALVQTAAMALLAYVGYHAGSTSHDRLLRSFFICYIAYCVAAGFASAPITDLFAKAIPSERRTFVIGQRNLWGGILAILAGLAIRQVYGHGPTFPRNYAEIFAATAVILAAATFFLARMREPQRVAAPRQRSSLARIMRDSPRVMGDPSFRRFLFFRSLLSVSTIADPFYILYAMRELNIPLRMAGLYLVGLAAARLVSGIFWQPLGGRRGHKSVLQVAALLRLVLPIVTLALPYIVDTSLYSDHVHNANVAYYVFGIVFLAYGASLAAQSQSNFAYLVDIAPPELRPSYAGHINLVLAVASLAPVAGGVILDRYGYDSLFFAAVLIGLAAVFVSGALTDANPQPRPAIEAWRLRRARP